MPHLGKIIAILNNAFQDSRFIPRLVEATQKYLRDRHICCLSSLGSRPSSTQLVLIKGEHAQKHCSLTLDILFATSHPEPTYLTNLPFAPQTHLLVLQTSSLAIPIPSSTTRSSMQPKGERARYHLLICAHPQVSSQPGYHNKFSAPKCWLQLYQHLR